DDQQRLSASLGREVLSVDLAILRNSRRNPSALRNAFAGVYARIANLQPHRTSVLIDVGATQQHSLLDYCALVVLNEDLVELKVPTIALMPPVADSESISQAARQL